MEMSLHYVKSQKGKDQLLYKGYLHKKERLLGDIALWKCADYHKYHCTGRAHTSKDQVIKFVPHLHPPGKTSVEAKKIACSSKKMGCSGQELTHKAVVGNQNGLPQAAADRKPRVQNVKETIQRLKACLNAARRTTCGLQTSATVAETRPQDPPLVSSANSSERPDGLVHRSVTAAPVTSNKMNASQSSMIQASQEAARQRFRLDTILPGEAPHEILSRLSEAAQQWLCPCEHDKDQIVDMVILEQFLKVLPVDIQAWVRAREPGSSQEVAQLTEDYLREQKVTKTTQARVTFEDVSVHFTEEEWSLLDHEEKKNYWDVMHQNYDNVAWLGDGSNNKDPWQLSPELGVKLSEKSKEEISQSPKQDSAGRNCLESQQQSPSGTKGENIVHCQSVLREVVRDSEPGPEARCIYADCENWDPSPTLIRNHRHPVKEDTESTVLSEELHEKKGSQNLEQNLNKEDSNNRQPNYTGNEQSKCICCINNLKDLVDQDSVPGQEIHCVCIESKFPVLANNQEHSSVKDSECIELSEVSAGISQNPEQALEPSSMHSEVSPPEMNGTTASMWENQNSPVSHPANHSGSEGEESSVTLGNNILGEQVRDALHLGAQPRPDLQNPYTNYGGQDESSKCICIQKSSHRDDLDILQRGFTLSSDPATQSSCSHYCGLSAFIKHRRFASKRKGVKKRNTYVKSSLDTHQRLHGGGKPKNGLKWENCRQCGCSPFEPGRDPQTLKHKQRFFSLPLLAKTATEPTVSQLMAVLQQVAMDTTEIKSLVTSVGITITGIQNALSGCTDEAEHRISDLEDNSRNTKAQLVQHCNDIKALEAKLTGKAVQTNVIAGLWSSVSVKKGTSPLN